MDTTKIKIYRILKYISIGLSIFFFISFVGLTIAYYNIEPTGEEISSIHVLINFLNYMSLVLFIVFLLATFTLIGMIRVARHRNMMKKYEERIKQEKESQPND